MFHFRKAYLLPLTGSECYRALKGSVSYIVFNIRASFFFFDLHDINTKIHK